jgi:hypothetical protein
VRFKGVLGGLEVDAVEHDVEIAAVTFDLGLRFALHGRLDRQVVEAEHVAQHGGVRVGRFRDIRPHDRPAVRQQHRGVEAVDHFGRPAPVDEISNQSPTFTLSAACAAASRATGTRYGEQLT